MQRELEAMVPISIELDWPKKDEIVKCILEQNARYGFKTFLLAATSYVQRAKAPYQVCDDGIILQIPLALCEPVYLLFQ